MRRRALLAGAAISLVLGAVVVHQLPEIAAGGLLYPYRSSTIAPAPAGCDEHRLMAAGVELSGWRCAASASPRRGTIVYLHGIADNRSSSAGVIRRYQPRGFDVLAYDSRRHGRSGGEICTYGFHEKQDLRRIIDTAGPGPVILFGTSLGAAIALQEVAEDARISGIVAAEVFSDLRTIALERAPAILPWWVVDRAFAIAERRGEFDVDEVSPAAAASRIRVPVLLIHGAEDRETPTRHSERVYRALRGPKRLMLVEGAGHNASLSVPALWDNRRMDRDDPGEGHVTRRLITSGSTFEQEIGYSRAVVEGEWIFVSGTTGYDYTTMTIPDGIVEQTERCLQNIEAALAQAGAGLRDVVRVTYIVPRADEFKECWPTLRRYFGEIRPAATMISAGLADTRMRIEIEVTARQAS